jgi:tetratricopeptide (TPR) repeat protein
VVLLSGGIGWVASDRASRVQRTTDEINSDLQESLDWQKQRRVPEALAAAHRAQAALAGGHANAAQRRRVEARLFDLNLLASLEEARLERTAVKDGHFDGELADRRYGEIFRHFNLDVEAGSVEEAGTHIRDSTVALELASFLDEWSIQRRLYLQDEARWNRLLDVARLADPDGWRCRLRDALAGKDRQALVSVASSDEVAHLLPWTASALTKALLLGGDVRPAEALLRKAQRQHPGEFWTNEVLGLLPKDSNPLRPEEAIRFLMVAVALRPQSPGAHVNLGCALHDKGDVDGAFAEYQEAVRLKKDYAEPHYNLGIALRDKGDVDGAIAAYREALRLNKDLDGAHYNLGVALFDKGQLEEAIAEYREALRLKKDYAGAHNNLGIALKGKGQLEEAIAEYHEALRL